MNKASAVEIERTVEIPAKDAAAIVAYRTANGAISSFDALERISGVDTVKLAAAKARLEF